MILIIIALFVVSFSMWFISNAQKNMKKRFSMFTQDKPNSKVVQTIKPHRHLTVKLYDVERFKNGDIDTNGGIYNLICRTLVYTDKDGNFICMEPTMDNGDFYLELKNLRTSEFVDIYAEILSAVTNFRFDLLVFNKDSLGFTGLIGEHMTQIRLHADELIKECFIRLVKEFESYSE